MAFDWSTDRAELGLDQKDEAQTLFTGLHELEPTGRAETGLTDFKIIF